MGKFKLWWGKFKQWILAHKLASIITASALVVCVTLSIVLPITLSHKHKYDEKWAYDATSHWHACIGEKCDKQKDNAEHTLKTKTDTTNHWQECDVCGYKKGAATHTYNQNHNDASHWQECSCGYKKDEVTHDLIVAEINDTNHKLGCVDCGYISGELIHTYEADDQVECDNCSHTRAEATLAFTSSFNETNRKKTYDGQSYSFDQSYVTCTSVSFSDIIIEYQSDNGGAEWTTEAPVNSGNYYIRLRVEANGEHTGFELSEDQKIVIEKKSLSLNDFRVVYRQADANRNRWSENVTSANISGILSSDSLQIRFVKNTSASISIEEGKCYNFSTRNDTSDALGVQIVGASNYTLDSSTTGKLYVAKAATSSGEGTSTSLYTYAAEATIAKNGIVYYSSAITRTGTGSAYAFNFNITLNDSNAKVVDVFTKSQYVSATLAADGTLVTYGPNTSSATIVFIGVKYEGEDANKSVTLTLTKNSSTTTMSSTNWENALKFTGSSRAHITLKKDGNVLEECKYNRNDRKYYNNNQGTEEYYDMSAIATCYKYTKNESGNWVRATTSYGSTNEADLAGYNATKFSSIWLGSFEEIFDSFTFSNEDQMYHLDSYTVGDDDVTYTDIALKFENNKLVYAEYEMENNKYTIEAEYPEYLTFDFPSSYTEA